MPMFPFSCTKQYERSAHDQCSSDFGVFIERQARIRAGSLPLPRQVGNSHVHPERGLAKQSQSQTSPQQLEQRSPTAS